MRARAVLKQARTEWLLTVRRGESLLVTVGIPVGILVFFSKIDTLSDVADPVAFLVPGILALAVMSTAMVSLGIATGYERHYGVLKRLGSTPLSRAGLLSAKTMNVLVIEAAQVFLIVVIGVALGWDLTGGILPAIGLLLLGTLAFAGIGMLMAGTLRAEANLAVAKVLPAAPLAETVRAVLDHPAHLPGSYLAVLIAWAVLAPLAAIAWFRWEE